MKDIAPNGWEVAGIEDLELAGMIQLGRGRVISKIDLANSPGSYPVYSSAKENDGKFGEYGEYMFDEELITWSVDGGGRLFHRPKHKFSITNVGGFVRILQPERIDCRYLYFALSFLHSQVVFDWVRKAHPSVIRKVYDKVPLPPLEEQQRIVTVLDEAFEGLTRARAHAEANLQNARELFTLELKEIFSQGKDGWTKAKIEDLCTIRSGTTVSKALERASGDVPYVKVADMNLADNLEGIVTSTRFLNANDVPERQIIRGGATIFPKRGGAILTNKKRKVLVDICADLNVMGVIPGPKIDEDFLHHYFLSIDMREIGSGSSIPQINNYDINPMMLSFPPDRSEQEDVADGLQLLRDKTAILSAAYRAKLSDIDALRQSLLQKAFAGELT